MANGNVLALLLTVLLLGTRPAMGSELSEAYQKCIDATDTNSGWGECSTQEIARQEKRLSDAWNVAFVGMKKVSPQDAQMLLNEQRAWVKFKDGSCLFYNSGDFGREGHVLGFGACRASIIAARVDALKTLAKEIASRK